jgi:hypothetical protein
MTIEEIKAIQTKIGVNPDGIFGPISRGTCIAYLRHLMPEEHPFPYRKDIRQFYGEPGEGSLTMINVAGLGVEYMGREVRVIKCHEMIADNLLDFIIAISQSKHRDILKEYIGCYNYRKSRTSDNLSTHAWGAAIDFKPKTNGNRTKWPETADMPFEVMEIAASFGFAAAGAFWGRDAMHFEAVRQ